MIRRLRKKTSATINTGAMEGQTNPTFVDASPMVAGEYGSVAKPNDGVDLASDLELHTIGTRSGHHDPPLPVESSMLLFFQVLFPFLVAGFGMVLAGIVLDAVQHWDLFTQVPETFILVPALLGLKGNLEMTLASRLSTQANTGKMDTKEQIITVVISNVALIQVQAIGVTLLASGFAMILAWIPKGEIDWGHASLLCASSLTTASLASFLLSGIMVIVILIARRYDINPDNIATPIAASLGDLTTLIILSTFGSLFLHAHLSDSWMNVIVIAAFLAACPIWAVAACRDGAAKIVLETGWTPIVLSMLLSSGGGFVLEKAMQSYKQMALFQPVINGVGGNLAAVHASRLSTFFHKNSIGIGLLPHGWTLRRFGAIDRAFFSSDWDARSARVLLFLVIPGHIIFNWLISLFHTGDNPPNSALFTSIYLTAAIVQFKQKLISAKLIFLIRSLSHDVFLQSLYGFEYC
uniref:Divalent cation transporter n=1 Tax=Panagrellus redivivus TaxID=6233 RepID=A0A7E4VGU1_PANRE